MRWKLGYDRDNTNLNYEDTSIRHILFPKRHKPMPVGRPAAQFAPFAALTGHQAAIEEAARVTDIRMELDEEMKEQLNVKLQKIVSEPGAENPTCIMFRWKKKVVAVIRQKHRES